MKNLTKLIKLPFTLLAICWNWIAVQLDHLEDDNDDDDDWYYDMCRFDNDDRNDYPKGW